MYALFFAHHVVYLLVVQCNHCRIRAMMCLSWSTCDQQQRKKGGQRAFLIKRAVDAVDAFSWTPWHLFAALLSMRPSHSKETWNSEQWSIHMLRFFASEKIGNGRYRIHTSAGCCFCRFLFFPLGHVVYGIYSYFYI